MSARFSELDWRTTPMGELVLRRRWDPMLDTEVHEIKLDDDFLMSSLFTVAEAEMGRIALAGLSGTALDVVVGGLGLGYTAQAVLEHPNVRSLVVVEALAEVIEWHERGLIPAGTTLTSDPRCTLVHGDFFDMLRSGAGLDPADGTRRFDAILVDIDHSPRHLLHHSHADFYEPDGLARVSELLRAGGVFALWSNDPRDDEFMDALDRDYAEARAEVVTFDNPFQGRESASTVYIAESARAQ